MECLYIKNGQVGKKAWDGILISQCMHSSHHWAYKYDNSGRTSGVDYHQIGSYGILFFS